MHHVSTNVPTLAYCSFDMHELILTISNQHTFKNGKLIQFSLFLYFYLLYFLLNSCHGNDTKQHVFLGRLLTALKSAGCVGWWLWRFSRFQSDVLSPLCLHVTAFSSDQLLRRWHFVIYFPICQWGTASSRCCHSTHIPALVPKFCSQPGLGPDFMADTGVER